MFWPMKTAGIAELKARLSAYLRDVERGEVVLVTDRGRVVAEVRPPGTSLALDARQLRYQKLVQSGAFRPATTPGLRSWLDRPSLGVQTDRVQAALDAERGE
jgi:antitoxin (DNA-binding transcriptional repressor) of toxin-antitoxin stability system